jgi:beta-N-acetylhexosaminidase
MHISLEEKIAQMCLIGIGIKEDIEAVKRMIKSSAIGGVVIFKNNYDTYKEMVKLIKELKESNKNNKFPLFIAINEEGGKHSNMPKRFQIIDNAAKLGKTHNMEFVKKAGNYTGNMLIKSGINMDLAPVLDLQTFSNNNEYSFSRNADLVAKYGLGFYKELKKQKLIGVVKHFPGLGAARTRRFIKLPIINNYDSVKATHLYPFIKAIQEDVDAIMVGHIIIKGKTGLYPCSLSSNFIKDELRKNLKYKGIVVTDELSKKRIKLIYGQKRAFKKAFIAGNDLIYCKYYPGITKDIISHIADLVRKDEIPEKNIRDSFKRIVLLKEKYNINNDTSYKGVNYNLINYKIKTLNKEIDDYLDGR